MTNLSRKVFTLVFVRDLPNRRLLLGYKKRGFGANKWNGLGGKVEPSETIAEGAMREAREEAGLEVDSLKKVGFIEFQFESKMNEILDVHVFCADGYSGTIRETEEMRPEWFSFDDIPYDNMWKDDRLWYPMLFQDRSLFKGYFLFKDDQETILEQRLNQVDSLD